MIGGSQEAKTLNILISFLLLPMHKFTIVEKKKFSVVVEDNTKTQYELNINSIQGLLEWQVGATIYATKVIKRSGFIFGTFMNEDEAFTPSMSLSDLKTAAINESNGAAKGLLSKMYHERTMAIVTLTQTLHQVKSKDDKKEIQEMIDACRDGL